MMMTKLYSDGSVFKRMLIRAVGLPLFVLIIFSAFNFLQIRHLLERSHWVDHTDRVLGQVAEAERLAVDAEAALRGFLLTEREEFLLPYKAARTSFAAKLNALIELVSDNPPQQQRFRKTRDAFDDWDLAASAVLKSQFNRKSNEFLQLLVQARNRMALIRGLFEAARGMETDLRTQRIVRAESAASRTSLFTVLLTLLFGTAIGWISRRQLMELSRSYEITLARSAELLTETQAQAEELRTQQEELEAGNQALSEKTDLLQMQQGALEEANQELEIQQSSLEEQKERLEFINLDLEAARNEIERKAQSLLVANKYKSEFLANMSHELRTPLNSVLILSRLLSENAQGRLNDEEIEFSQMIHSSASDLLNLINDILDLAKVEAGKLTIHIEPVPVTDIAQHLEKMFRVGMQQKGLRFEIEIDPSCPPAIVTDGSRVEQIVRNFLSNSLKFTQKGHVRLKLERTAPTEVSPHAPAVAITVSDSGIGIPKDKVDLIFEAFQQVDGTINRRFGGTGLGLTIAREYAALLGGRVALKSNVGEGTSLTLFLPEVITPKQAETQGDQVREKALQRDELLLVAKQASAPILTAPHDPSAPPRNGAHGIADDRSRLAPGDQTVLIVEDDPHFAKILVGVCRERGFLCLLASDGETGLSDAMQFRPGAVLLDVRLPGIDGVQVLHRLKSNFATRHIPVHVLSVEDKEREVLRMGAMGFLEKPVERAAIVNALEQIREVMSSKTRRVLVVEDNDIERQSIIRLVGDGDVVTTGVVSGEEALEAMKETRFDCVILDLGLPDMSGFELIDAIHSDKSMPHPPLIVYSGKELSREEKNRLDGYSSSVIIKGAKSPERLLNEVTLFLHSVEEKLPKHTREILQKVRNREEAFEGKKLLLVDDDMRNVFALRNVLIQKGFDLVVGKTGKEALDQLQKHPDTAVVLMDIMMPEMDGYEAMRHIRQNPAHHKLPIIALTAKAMRGDKEKCLEAGANDYLSKPIDVDRLLSILRVWVENG